MTRQRAPVAIIGGGISGAAACLRLAALDIDVLWITPLVNGTEKPGEHLAAAARPLLAQLGIEDLLDRHYHRGANALFSAWGSDPLVERNAIVHLEGPATVLDRMAFEHDLAERVLSRGVHQVEAMLTVAERCDDLWHLQLGKTTAQASFLLDATGRNASIARHYARRYRADRLAALYTFLERAPDADVEPTQATLIESTSTGWWYAALRANKSLALNFYTDPALIPRQATRDTAVLQTLLQETRYISRWIADVGFSLDSPPRIARADTTWIAPAAGAGWAAIGDAAAAFDPLSSHGMTTALWTAITAADAAAAALSGQTTPLARYADRVAAGVQDFLHSRSSIYSQETRFADQPFWQQRRIPDPA